MPVKLPFYAAEFPLKQIPDLLCEDGPYQCPTCEVPCAFGLRFLREIDSDPRPGKPIILPESEVPPRTIAAQWKVYNALRDMADGGLSKDEACAKYGYSNRKQLDAAIRCHKEKALARFGGGESAGDELGGTSPSLYHK